MILSGIVYVQLVPSNDPRVIGLLVAGFACLIFFALWETFYPLAEPLTPSRMFTKNQRPRSYRSVCGGFRSHDVLLRHQHYLADDGGSVLHQLHDTCAYRLPPRHGSRFWDLHGRYDPIVWWWLLPALEVADGRSHYVNGKYTHGRKPCLSVAT